MENTNFGQIYFVDFVELRALKEFLNFAINIFNHIIDKGLQVRKTLRVPFVSLGHTLK